MPTDHYADRSTEWFSDYIIAHILSPAAVEDAPVTTLIAGSTVDVSYHLAYPHRVNLYVLLKHHT